MKIAHLVNPVLVKPSSDLFIAQPITFESMRIAQQQAAGDVKVDLLAVGHPEDQPVMPEGFQALPSLTRSVLDVATFKKQRKLPFLGDIVSRLYDGSEADVLIYTNVDIGLQPEFYLAVQEFIDQGFDAFVINRRTIPSRYTTIDQLPQMWAEVGEAHRGWDCFIFPRDMVPKFRLGSVCVGATRVGLALLSNLVAHGRSFMEFKDDHLTFHIGDERRLKDPAFADYDAHKTRELMGVLSTLEMETGPFGRYTIPGSFLWRIHTFGWLYESWTRRAYLPVKWSQRLDRLISKLPGTQ